MTLIRFGERQLFFTEEDVIKAYAEKEKQKKQTKNTTEIPATKIVA